MSSRQALRALAKAYGVQRQFVGAGRERFTASDDTLLALLQLLGVGIERADDAAEALAAHEADRAAAVVDPVAVQWGRTPARLQLRPPAAGATHVAAELDDGTGREWVVDADAQGRVVLPEVLPIGTHTMHVRGGGRSGDVTVLAAPAKLRSGPPRFGVFVPMYALHERDQVTTGTVTTFNRFTHWAGATGATVMGTLPVLASFFGAGSEPCEPSPYVPVTRRHWNEVYLDLAAVPEARGATVREPSPGPLVDLPALAAAKRTVLEHALRALDDTLARREEFEEWCDTRADVVEYACFRAAVEAFGPETTADPGIEEPAARYHAYVQWLIEAQLARLAADMRERDQELYLDLPIGTHPDGFDVARQPHLFARGASAGAPPDLFFAGGQSWGFPPVLPHVARATGYRYLRECLDAHFRVARWLRVDHVIGLHRLWWVPNGASPKDGAYVSYAADEEYAVLAIAAAKAGGRIVGENLGTVPPETNRTLRKRGMLGMYVVQFAYSVDDEPHAPAANDLACVDTHDTATFAQYWHDLEPPARGALLDTLRAAGCLATTSGETPDPTEVLSAVLAWLGTTDAEVVLATLEDLWLELDPQNVPGTTGEEHPNFRRRCARSLADLDASDHERELLCRIDRARQGRSPSP